MYSAIFNIKKQKWEQIESPIGKIIIKKYIKYLYGDMLSKIQKGSGWGDHTHKSQKKRKIHNDNCMKKKKRCYLYYNKYTKQYKFPICPLNSCSHNCDGILAAKKRAALHKYDKVKMEAQCFGNKLKCKWSKRDKLLNDYVKTKCSTKKCIC